MAVPRKKVSHLKKRHRFMSHVKKAIIKMVKMHDSVASQKSIEPEKTVSKKKVIKA